MKKAIIVMAAILATSPALAMGATKSAPGHQMHKATKSTGHGASSYAPGHQTTGAGPGHSASAPGQKSHTTTGSNAAKKSY